MPAKSSWRTTALLASVINRERRQTIYIIPSCATTKRYKLIRGRAAEHLSPSDLNFLSISGRQRSLSFAFEFGRGARQIGHLHVEAKLWTATITYTEAHGCCQSALSQTHVAIEQLARVKDNSRTTPLSARHGSSCSTAALNELVDGDGKRRIQVRLLRLRPEFVTLQHQAH